MMGSEIGGWVGVGSMLLGASGLVFLWWKSRQPSSGTASSAGAGIGAMLVVGGALCYVPILVGATVTAGSWGGGHWVAPTLVGGTILPFVVWKCI